MHIKAIIDEQIGVLEKSAATLLIPIEQGGPEDPTDAEADKDLLETIQKGMQDNGGRIDDERLLGWVQKKLGSMGCRNQGYVLDGFPKTDEQAKKTFLNPNGEAADVPDPELLPGLPRACIVAPNDIARQSLCLRSTRRTTC